MTSLKDQKHIFDIIIIIVIVVVATVVIVIIIIKVNYYDFPENYYLFSSCSRGSHFAYFAILHTLYYTLHFTLKYRLHSHLLASWTKSWKRQNSMGPTDVQPLPSKFLTLQSSMLVSTDNKQKRRITKKTGVENIF